MKKLILFTVLLSLVLAISSFGQIVRLDPKKGYYKDPFTDTSGADSTSAYNRYYFYVPEEVQTDTLQLQLWLYSSDGAAHVKLYYMWAYTTAKNKKTSGGDGGYHLSAGDSATLSADYSTEGYTAFMLVGTADDTLQNATNAMKIWPDAIVVSVTGTTSNRADTEYGLKIFGRVGSANNQ